MITKLTVGAAGVLWCVATIVVASPTIDTSLSNYPEWNDTVSPRSVVATSPVIQDSAVQPVSDNEPVAATSDNCWLLELRRVRRMQHVPMLRADVQRDRRCRVSASFDGPVPKRS